MATLNPYQQYSQSENTITNNVLLLLSNLYEVSPSYYEAFIVGISDEADYEVVPNFLQQKKSRGGGIIDGFIQLKPSKIIIETKIDTLDSKDKLLKYTKSFDNYGKNILIHLSKVKFSKSDRDKITEELAQGEEYKNKRVQFYSLSYEDLVDQLHSLVSIYPHETALARIANYFEDYCLGMDLILEKHMLRVMACGGSFAINVKHEVYFDIAHRGYSHFNYLGIYREKAVHFIGEVENVIVADLENGNLDIHEKRHEVSKEQEERIKTLIQDAKGWALDRGIRFFLLKNFHATDFRKSSKGGLQRVRFLNLKEYLTQGVPDSLAEIAEALRDLEWR